MHRYLFSWFLFIFRSLTFILTLNWSNPHKKYIFKLGFVYFYRFLFDLVYILHSITLTGDGRQPLQQTKFFLDDPEKLYRQRLCEAQAKKLEQVDLKDEADGSSSTHQSTPPPSLKREAPPLEMALLEERTIDELYILDIWDLPIQDLNNIGVSFEIKTSTIQMVQRTPFTCKEDATLHRKAFTQLCRTCFDM